MRDQYLIENPPPIEMQFIHSDHTLSTSEIAQRNAWTINRLQSTSKEELMEIRQEVIDSAPTAYATGRLRKGIIKALAYIRLRRRYNCPHP